MSLINRLTPSALPKETLNQFVATFNVPTVGVYDYTNVAANQNQVALELDGKYIYMIERVSFSASIDEGNYFESINVLPQIRLKYRDTPGLLYPFPFPCLNYKDNMEFNFYFNTPQDNDALLVDFTGVLNQIAATVGITTIRAAFSMVIYEEHDNAVITAFKSGKWKAIECFNS